MSGPRPPPSLGPRRVALAFPPPASGGRDPAARSAPPAAARGSGGRLRCCQTLSLLQQGEAPPGSCLPALLPGEAGTWAGKAACAAGLPPKRASRLVEVHRCLGRQNSFAPSPSLKEAGSGCCLC